MKLTFLGTRGYIEAVKRRHRFHTATLVEYRRARVMLDCGEDWRGRLRAVAPQAVVVTHAHPDHAGGIGPELSCPVYATQQSWDRMARSVLPARQHRVIQPGRPFRISGITFEAVAVAHSVRAPAVGYRISAGNKHVFYVPDVLDLPGRPAVLEGLDVYVGDGAAIVRPIARRTRADGHQWIGHTSIRAQLDWCRDAKVPRMIVTHCGTEIVGGDERRTAARVRALGRERGVEVEIAHDGWMCIIR